MTVVAVLVLVCGVGATSFAERKLTSDLVIISGGRSSEHWDDTDLTTIDGKEAYFALGTITLTARATSGGSLDVVVWGRGSGDLQFFDFDTARIDGGLVPDQPTERDPSQHRQTAPLAPRAWSADLRPHDLLAGERPERERASGTLDSVVAWTRLIAQLRNKGTLAPVWRTKLLPNEPRVVGYIVRLPSSSAKQSTAEIVVAANDTEPEKFPIGLSVEVSIFDSPKKLFSALLTPALTVSLGGLLGVVTAYFGFLAQQKYLWRAETERKFEEKKIELSQKLWKFFKQDKTYGALRSANRDELAKVQQIRDALIEEGIYAILPQHEIAELTRLCNASVAVKASRLAKVDELLTSRFGEFIL